MANQYQRYNKEGLSLLIKESASYAEVARKLGKSPVGGTLTNIRLMCQRWGIDTNHMTGQAHNKGKRSNKRRTPDQVLKMGSSLDHRTAAQKLRRALFELNVLHVCNCCGIDEWCGSKLVLEIDHIDGQYWNNERNNLQFLCPNCHSQK